MDSDLTKDYVMDDYSLMIVRSPDANPDPSYSALAQLAIEADRELQRRIEQRDSRFKALEKELLDIVKELDGTESRLYATGAERASRQRLLALRAAHMSVLEADTSSMHESTPLPVYSSVLHSGLSHAQPPPLMPLPTTPAAAAIDSFLASSQPVEIITEQIAQPLIASTAAPAPQAAAPAPAAASSTRSPSRPSSRPRSRPAASSRRDFTPNLSSTYAEVVIQAENTRLRHQQRQQRQRRIEPLRK